MIAKDELKGKYVTYMDTDGKHRIGKVTKISGNYVTVKNVLRKKKRVYKDKIIGRQLKNKIVEIDWKRKERNRNGNEKRTEIV